MNYFTIVKYITKILGVATIIINPPWCVYLIEYAEKVKEVSVAFNTNYAGAHLFFPTVDRRSSDLEEVKTNDDGNVATSSDAPKSTAVTTTISTKKCTLFPPNDDFTLYDSRSNAVVVMTYIVCWLLIGQIPVAAFMLYGAYKCKPRLLVPFLILTLLIVITGSVKLYVSYEYNYKTHTAWLGKALLWVLQPVFSMASILPVYIYYRLLLSRSSSR